MMRILTWIDSGKKFGIPVEECREVNRDIQLTQVPHSKDFISGIVNLRGDTVTVIDLANLLGYKVNTDRIHNVTIRLKSSSNNLAIRAETVDDILELEDEKLEDAINQLGEEEARFINKVALTPEGLILVLDTKAIQNLNVQ